MFLPEFSDEEDNDILLRYNQFNEEHHNRFNERHDLETDRLRNLAAISLRLLRRFQDDEDVLQHDQNQEDIITLGCVESDPKLEAQQDGLPRGLDAQEEIRGGYKHKRRRRKRNKECSFQDPFYNLQYDIEEEEDILRRLELDSEFKAEPEQNDNKEDEDILRRLELDDEMRKTGQNDNTEDEAFMESAVRQLKKEQTGPHICSNCHQRVPDRESDIEMKQRMDEAIEKEASQPENIKEEEYPLVQFMELVPEAVNAAENNKQKDLQRRLKQKMTTLETLLDLEEIGLEFYIFIDHIILILNLNDDDDDREKVRSEVEDKLKYLEKVKDLLLTSSKTVNKVINEVERMKNKDEEKTQNIPEILAQFMEFNAHLVERSFHHGIGFVFDNNSTKTELSCVKELNRSREKLEIILRRLGKMIKRETGMRD